MHRWNGGWWKELNVKWKGIDPFHARKWFELRCNGLGKKGLKSAPDVQFPQLGGQRAVTLAASRQVTGGQPTQMRLETQNAVF